MAGRRTRPSSPAPPGAGGEPLRLPAFRRLAVAYTVNELGNWLGDLALAVLVFDATRSALATAALFVATRFVPALAGPVLGVRLEHADGRVSLAGLYAAEAAAFGGLALLAGHAPVAVVVAVAGLDGVLSVGARALSRGATVALVGSGGGLRRANATLNLAFTACAAAGPALAGVLIAAAGPAPTLALDGLSFAVVAAVVARGPSLPLHAAPGASTRERLRAGIRHVRGRPLLRALLLGQAVALVFFAAVLPVEVVFVKATLHRGDGAFGAMLGSWGVGMVAGGLAFAVARRVPAGALLAAGTAVIAASYLGIAAAPGIEVACGASAIGGLGNGVQAIALLTAVQQATGSGMHARVMALLEGVSALMPGVGFAVGGAAAALLSPRAAYAVAGAGVLLALLGAGLLAGASRRRQAALATPR